MKSRILNLIKNNKWVILLFTIVTTLVAIHYSDFFQIVDEGAHFEQIERTRTNNGMTPLLTTIPGFHFLVSHSLSVLGTYEMKYARFVSLIFSLSGLFFLYKTIGFFNREDKALKVVSVYTLPIIFPFIILLYTDLTALSFVLACFYFSLRKKYLIAVIIGTCSICIRQTNILWIFFVYAYIFLTHFKDGVSKNKIRQFIIPTVGFALCGVGFIIFVFINGGIAMGDKSMHPAFELSLGNPLFFLFSFFILLLPFCLSRIPVVLKRLEESNYLWIIAICVFIISFFNCHFDHPYNAGGFFIRNIILVEVQKSLLVQVIFCLICTFSFMIILTSKLYNKASYIFYPVFFLLISSSSLVEVRYLIIGFVFIAIFLNEKQNTKTQLVYNSLLSIACWYGITNSILFL